MENGIGPRGISLLHKLKAKRAFEMTEGELLQLVEKDRERRVTQRTLGRVLRQGQEVRTVTHRTKKPPPTLESYGLAPNICAQLRASGRPDADIIKDLKKVGLVK